MKEDCLKQIQLKDMLFIIELENKIVIYRVC
jgi:hypothetical protein